MPTYKVQYAITREETYRVEAETATEAEEIAFSEGVYLGSDETTNCETLAVKKVKL